MKTSKNILVTGMVVAAVMVAGGSVYASTNVLEDGVATVTERQGFGHRGKLSVGASKDFSAAVEAGVLTQDEADDILVYLEANKLDRETIKEATEGMTREEAKDYMTENYPKVDLVEEGLLTQAQVEELKVLKPERDMEAGKKSNGEKSRTSRGGYGFEAAVEAGILTQDEADAISEYRDENKVDKEDLEVELDGLSKEEVRTYMEENYPKSEDPLGDLVDEDLLTEDQAEEIQALRDEVKASRSERAEKSEDESGRAGSMRSTSVNRGIAR